MVTCPLCDAELELEKDEVDEGDTVTCDECGSDLRIVGTEPLDLEPVEEEEEDDDADADFDDEDEEEEEEDWK
jgi:alpha-aminoadipate/glutamate carrier protein LysW